MKKTHNPTQKPTYSTPGGNTCSCIGDPHCTSFNGVADTWMLCDARFTTKKGCSYSEDVCLQQKDKDGNTCVWLPQTGKKWSTTLYGSQCVPDSKSSQASILMYSADDFSFSTYLGSMGIVTMIQLVTNSVTYSMTAEDCFTGQWGLPNIITQETLIVSKKIIELLITEKKHRNSSKNLM